MSLKDFQTYLWPETKTGKLGFYQKPTAAFPSGRVLEADFSRPDIAATSGATVFRDGQLIELGENDPDWDDANGCPRLLMRPQVQQVKGYQDFFLGSSFTDNGAATAFGLTGKNVSQAAGEQANLGGCTINGSASLTAGQPYVVTIVIEEVDRYFYLNYTLIGEFWIDLNDDSIILNNWDDFLITRNNGYLFLSLVINSAPSTTTVAQLRIGYTANNVVKQTAANTFDIIAGGLVNTSALQHYFISANTVPFTRSANQFTFDDLVTKGLIGGDGSFSFVLNSLWKDTGADVDILKFQTAASADQLVLRAKTGGNLIWAYEGGSGLVELGTGLAVNTEAKIGLSYDGSNILLSVNGASDTSAAVSLDTITKLFCPPNNRYLEIRQSDVLNAFTPIAQTQTELNNSTSA